MRALEPILRIKLDDEGMSKMDVLMSLAVLSKWIIEREPHDPEVQGQLVQFVSPAIELLMHMDKGRTE